MFQLLPESRQQLGLVSLSSRVRVMIRVKVRVSVMVSIITSWVVNFALFQCYRPVIYTRPAAGNKMLTV